MPVFVTHDAQGNILNIAVPISSSADDAPFAIVTAESVPSVTSEIEESELLSALNLNDLGRDPEQLIELAQRLGDFRIDTGEARIIRR